MPDARLTRTRMAIPTIPACVRLGHEWRHYDQLKMAECIRCRLRVDTAVVIRDAYACIKRELIPAGA